MARPIDADALLKAVRAIAAISHPDPILGAFHRSECQKFLEMIKNTPSLEAIEVVRCIDCQHHKHGFCEKISELYDGESDLAPGIYEMVDPDHFCGWGERRK